MSDPWQRISVVVVTHRSAAVIANCIDSIGSAAEVVVVDNASDDTTLDIVASKSIHATVQSNPINVGFGAGTNQGLRLVTREFALLANPDCQFDTNSIKLLLEAADKYAEAVWLAPRVLNQSGLDELPYDVELFKRPFFPDRKNERIPEGECCAEYLSGALILMRMSAYTKVGPFDEGIFLYYEDDDFCLRLRKLGFALILVPQAVVSHVGGGSVRNSLHYRWQKFWHMAWSRLYLEEKYRGPVARNKIAYPNLVRFTLKALGNAIILNHAKFLRDIARLMGTAAYILKVPASKTTSRARPTGSNITG